MEGERRARPGRPRKPRCTLCGSDRRLPFGEERCEICRRVCVCGRRIEYPGCGRPRRLCRACEEINLAKSVCPCGMLIRRGLKRFCSAECRRAARRIRAGGRPPEPWALDWGRVAATEAAHSATARVIVAWLRVGGLVHNPDRVYSQGATIWSLPRRRVAEVRQTDLDFNAQGGLPERVPVDDEARYEALDPPPALYLLVNRARDAVAGIAASPIDSVGWERERGWVPRYAAEDYVLLCPRGRASIRSLRLD